MEDPTPSPDRRPTRLDLSGSSDRGESAAGFALLQIRW
jgi:hypothetical protein